MGPVITSYLPPTYTINPCSFAQERNSHMKPLLNPIVRYISVNNLGSSTIGYQIRARCFIEPASIPCPSPSPNLGPCSNPLTSKRGSNGRRGECSHLPSNSDSICNCFPGYGDYGCNANIQALKNGQEVSISLPARSWVYFSPVSVGSLIYIADGTWQEAL